MTNESLSEREFDLAGTPVRIVLRGGDPTLVDAARSRLTELLARWARTGAQSEVLAVNAAAGSTVAVSPETLDLARRAQAWCESTQGWFDPVPCEIGPRRWPSSRDELTIDSVNGTLAVEPGAVLDLEGVATGRATDLVTAELACRAAGVLVEIGSVGRTYGDGPGASDWCIALTGVNAARACVAFGSGAVATSSAWRDRLPDGRRLGRLGDPATVGSATGDLASVTVIAGEAERAIVLARAARAAGATRGASLLADHDVAAQFELFDGSVERFGGFDRFVVGPTTRLAA